MAGQPGSGKEDGNDERDRMDRRDLESCDRMQLPDAVFGLPQLLKGESGVSAGMPTCQVPP